MKIMLAVLVLLLQAYPPGQDDYPEGPGTGAPAATICPCFDDTTAAGYASGALGGAAAFSCGTQVAPDVAALCALGYVLQSCTAGAPTFQAFYQWDAGASTCQLNDGVALANVVVSAAGLSAAQVAKCVADAEAGVVALGVAGCNPS